MSCLSEAQTFREFSGDNGGGNTNPLYSKAIGWNRLDLSWGSLEPTKGNWQQAILDSYANNVLAMQNSNVHVLPMLGYTAGWAATTVGDSKSPPANVADWTNYVSRVVNQLKASPYNVQYFQIWNEAGENNTPFWHGSLATYFAKIHIPASQVIRAAGCKVVYGGWPDNMSPSWMISALDANKAWSSIDIIDMHYFGWADLEIMRAAAASRGYPNMGFWRSEVGFTTDQLFICNEYPRTLTWSLTHNWTGGDKHKIMYFNNWAPSDPAAYGYHCCLNSGNSLNWHGLQLQTLGDLLDGGTLSALPGVTSAPAISAIDSIRVADRLIVAAHLSQATYNANTSVTFTFPITRSQILKAERIDLTGTSVDCTSALVTSGGSTTLNVSTRDATGSSAKAWNEGTSSKSRVFYVKLTLAATLPTLKFETENLAATWTSGLGHRLISDPAASNGSATILDATAPGDQVTYTVPGVSAAIYDLRVGVKNFNPRGIFQNAIAPVATGAFMNHGSPVDEYSSGPVWAEVDLGLVALGTSGDKLFKFTVTGKNAASTGYPISFDYIKLIPQ